MYRAGVNSFDVFAGIQRSRLDVKNPMPTRYAVANYFQTLGCFCLFVCLTHLHAFSVDLPYLHCIILDMAFGLNP